MIKGEIVYPKGQSKKTAFPPGSVPSIGDHIAIGPDYAQVARKEWVEYKKTTGENHFRIEWEVKIYLR